MTIYVFYSNIILIALNLNVVNQDQSQALGTILALFLWHLEFRLFSLCYPPVLCLTKAEDHSRSLSANYFSFCFNWICIKLHSRDYKIVTWLWQLLNRLIFKHLNVTWNSGRTVIDAFATFFLLSFSKMTLMLLFPLGPLAIHSLYIVDLSPKVTIQSYTEPSVNFVSKEHLPFAAIFIVLFLFGALPPVVLITLYPIQVFRSLRFRCLPKQSIGPLNIFC